MATDIFYPGSIDVFRVRFVPCLMNDDDHLGLRTPLEILMPMSSVPCSDWPIENGLVICDDGIVL